MDAMDILGGLLGGGKSQSGGSQSGGSLGGKILGELLKGGRRSAPAAREQAPPQSSGRGPSSRRPTDLNQRASELEDLLGVAKDRYARPTQAPAAPQPAPRSMPQQAPTSSRQAPASSQRGGFSFDDRTPVGRVDALDPNEEALVLIRAMIRAAKSDGRITPEEQQEIVGRINNPTQDAIDFLRQEFTLPADAREFAWSVPIGMEQKVYTISLAAIDLDTNSEATYLRELAHGLRLEPEFCNQLHTQYGAPTLY